MTRIFSSCAAALITAAFSATASAQPFTNQSYANLYSWQLGTSGQTLNPNTYLWDRYYYNNPNVSPYLNLSRAQPYGGTDYFTYVQPLEQQRQNQAYIESRLPPSGGHTPARPAASPGSMIQPGAYNSPGSMIQRGQSPPSNYGGEIMPYSTNAPNRSESFYHNHYYGGWEGRN